MIGLGTGMFGASEEGNVKQDVMEAIRMGYRYIDCADVCRNEHEVGLEVLAGRERGQGGGGGVRAPGSHLHELPQH